jgi:hypothetical protein
MISSRGCLKRGPSVSHMPRSPEYFGEIALAWECVMIPTLVDDTAQHRIVALRVA